MFTKVRSFFRNPSHVGFYGRTTNCVFGTYFLSKRWQGANEQKWHFMVLFLAKSTFCDTSVLLLGNLIVDYN
jgi:hypothetical protein